MTSPSSPYVDQRDGGLYVAGTRVSLDSVVLAFRDGASPESINRSFPTLDLAMIYGSIAYYLENRTLIDEYLDDADREFERAAVPLSKTNPALFARLEAAKRQLGSKRS